MPSLRRDLRQEKNRGQGASKSPDEISSDSSGLLSISIICNPWGKHTRNKSKRTQDKIKENTADSEMRNRVGLLSTKSTDRAVVGSTGYWAALLV